MHQGGAAHPGLAKKRKEFYEFIIFLFGNSLDLCNVLFVLVQWFLVQFKCVQGVPGKRKKG